MAEAFEPCTGPAEYEWAGIKRKVRLMRKNTQEADFVIDPFLRNGFIGLLLNLVLNLNLNLILSCQGFSFILT
jgi:hypothetical protein